MPGRLFLTRPASRAAALIGADPGGIDDPPRRNIQPGQDVVTVGPDLVMTRMRWGMIPVGRKNARGRPVMETIVNARSETLFEKSAFAGVGRAVVPADGWYEWTGARGRKTAWRIRDAEGACLWFAAICDLWQAPGGTALWQAATVTCAPSADVRDIHDRMGVLLTPETVPIWLQASETQAAALMQPALDGSLTVERADDVDWQAP